MITVEVNKKQVKIPSKYSEIKVSEFTSYWKILQKYDLLQEEDIIKRDSDEMDCTLEIVAHMLDIKPEDVNKIPYDKAYEVIKVFNNMLERDNFKDDYSGWTFTHNGEYAEVKQLEAILGKDVSNRFDFIPQQMAILCRKSGEGKNDFDREEREKEFENLTMDIVMRFAFFLSKWNLLLSKSTLISTEKAQVSERKLAIS